MVCQGMYFDEMERIVNIKNFQIKESANRNSVNKTVRKGKSKGMYFER